MRARTLRPVAALATTGWLLLGGGAGGQQEPLAIEGASSAPSVAEETAAAPAVDVSGEPGELFVGANRAYEEGDYRRAIALFRELLDQGHASGRLHYNLGNAYLRNGELGRAVASYRRSRALLPRNEDVRANLAFARKSTKDAIAPPEPSAALSTLFFWHYGLARSELAAIALLLNVLFWGLLALRLRFRTQESLRWILAVVLVPLVAVVGSIGAGLVFPRPVAVVVPQEVTAHTGPDGDTVVRFQLHAGTEVLVRDRGDGWLRIALPDGQQGWVEEGWVEVVDG